MNSAISGFLGGSPASVALRLLVISFVVGLLLAMFGFEPDDIYAGVVRLFRRVLEFGLGDFREIGRVLLTGAMVVVPLWLLSRLLNGRSAR